MKTKKQLLLLIILTALFQLAACGQSPSGSAPTVSASTQPTYTPYPTNAPYPTYTPFVQTASVDISYPNSLISLTVYFPGNYVLVKGDEENRRGSFLHYKFEPFGDFIPANDLYFSSQPPYFYEIQFFDEESIDNFLKNCAATDLGGMPCFEGDYPDLDRYHAQKEAFTNMRSYDDYDLKRFGNRYYFTSTIGCGGGYCRIREYTTFIDKIKVDIWILLDPSDVESQAELSDELFKSFYIETH